MFKRAHQPAPDPATGTFCRMCGGGVTVDTDGRCRLGHAVADPDAVALSTPTSAAPRGDDEADIEAGSSALGTEHDVIDGAQDASGASTGEPAAPDDTDVAGAGPASWFSSPLDELTEGGSPADSRAGVPGTSRASVTSGESATHEDADAGEASPEEGRSAEASAGQTEGESRQRLLEAANWFSMDSDSPR